MTLAIRKGTPALIYIPDQIVPTSSLTTDAATGSWRLGRVSAWHRAGSRRIVDAIDGIALDIITGWTHTLEPGRPYGVSIAPIAHRPETKALIGQDWPNGGAVFATLEPIRQAVVSEPSC